VDFDGDGRQDILAGSWPGEIYVFRRQEDGHFAAGKVLTDAKGKAINVGSAAAFAADWDGDGDLDILLGDFCGNSPAKPAQSGAERAAERAAIDQLPKLRSRWSSAFRRYRERLGAATPETIWTIEPRSCNRCAKR